MVDALTCDLWEVLYNRDSNTTTGDVLHSIFWSSERCKHGPSKKLADGTSVPTPDHTRVLGWRRGPENPPAMPHEAHAAAVPARAPEIPAPPPVTIPDGPAAVGQLPGIGNMDGGDEIVGDVQLLPGEAPIPDPALKPAVDVDGLGAMNNAQALPDVDPVRRKIAGQKALDTIPFKVADAPT